MYTESFYIEIDFIYDASITDEAFFLTSWNDWCLNKNKREHCLLFRLASSHVPLEKILILSIFKHLPMLTEFQKISSY